MKLNSKALPFTSKALFTIVGGAVLVNPVYAQDQASEELDEVVVTGLRGSLTAARDIKRESVGVVDAISAEDIGKFPDSNLSESLQRITGVSIDRRNGEGALVTARGFGAQFNMVTLNGRMMPAADAFAGNGGTSRAFNFANLASEAITGLEVYKTSRASIATGGIGATINVKTARPLDADAGLNANVGLKLVNDTTNRVGDDITPELSGIFSFANDAQTFGIGLTASYQQRDSGSSSSTVNDWRIQPWQARVIDNAGTAPLVVNNNGTPADATDDFVTSTIVNAPAAGQLYAIPNDIRYHFSDRERTRTNAQLTVQFAPSEAWLLTADYTYAEQELIEDRGDQTIWMNRNGYTRIEFDTGRSVATPLVLAENTGNNKDFGYEQQHREQTNKLKSAGFNADWTVSDNLNLKLDFHDSTAESLPSDPITGGGETTFSFAGRSPSFATQTFFFNDRLPLATRTVNGNANYTFQPSELGTQVLRVNYQDQVTDITQVRLDGTLKFEDVGSLNFGIETRAMEMTQRGSENFMTLGNWGVANLGEIPTGLLTPFSLVNEFEDFSVAGVPVGGWKGNAIQLAQWAMGPYGTWRDAAANNPNDSLQYNPGFNQNNTVEEDTKSIYFQFNIKGELGSFPFNLQTGVRYEETDVTSTSALLLPTAIGWEDNNDFFVVRQSTFTPFSQDAEYDHVLPSLDFDLGLTDNLKARFSYSKTIARPAYNQLRSSVTVGTPQGSTINGFLPTAAGSNPALVPLESDNLDLSLEYYFGESSYVSLGLFEKRVANFIGNEVVQEQLFGIRNQTGGPRAQAARQELINRGFPTNDTNLFVMMAMIANPQGANGLDVGGAAAFNGTEAQWLRIAAAFDLLPAADDPLYTFNVTRPVNNREAKLYGAELAGQHFFGDSGFGVQANYTIVNGDVAYNDAGDPNITQFALLGLSDSANVVAMYEKFGLSVRVAYNWRDEFLQNNARGGWRNPEYVEAYDQIDLNVGYNFNDHFSVSLEAINLTGEDVRWHGRSDLQMWFLEDQGPRYALGARYKF